MVHMKQPLGALDAVSRLLGLNATPGARQTRTWGDPLMERKLLFAACLALACTVVLGQEQVSENYAHVGGITDGFGRRLESNLSYMPCPKLSIIDLSKSM